MKPSLSRSTPPAVLVVAAALLIVAVLDSPAANDPRFRRDHAAANAPPLGPTPLLLGGAP